MASCFAKSRLFPGLGTLYCPNIPRAASIFVYLFLFIYLSIGCVDRFPNEFSFILNKEEFREQLSQFVIASPKNKSQQRFRNINKPPRVFTEHGALMASTILRTGQAKAMSLFIIRAFLKMREELSANNTIIKRLAEVEKNLLQHDQSLWDLYQKLLPLLQAPPDEPKKQMGFHQSSL